MSGKPKRRTQPKEALGGLGILVVLVGATVLAGRRLAAWGLPPWAAWLVALPCVVAAFLLLVIAVLPLTPRGRRVLGAIAQLLLREREGADLAAARQAAGTQGFVLRVGRVAVWSDRMDGAARTAAYVAGEVASRFEELLALSAPPCRKPLRILCFSAEAAFETYTQGMFVTVGRARGHYSGFWFARIAICRELAERLPSSLPATVAHEVTHFLLRASVRRRPPVWLDEGLAETLARRFGPAHRAPGRLARWLRAAQARGDLLPAAGLLALTRRKLARRWQNWDDLPSVAFVETVYTQSGGFVAFLAETWPEAFRPFLAALPCRHRARRVFARCFGLSPDEAMTRWIDAATADPAPLVPPTDDLKLRIEAELVQPILSPHASPDQRRLAIRLMGSLGYAWRADALIEILAGPDEPLRAEARRALECIAGELRGDAPHDWHPWLTALPRGVACD